MRQLTVKYRLNLNKTVEDRIATVLVVCYSIATGSSLEFKPTLPIVYQFSWSDELSDVGLYCSTNVAVKWEEGVTSTVGVIS